MMRASCAARLALRVAAPRTRAVAPATLLAAPRLLAVPALTRGLAKCMDRSFPPHTVLVMPALSPTMEAGGLTNWVLKEGDAIRPGARICEIETDKATVDYEAQDDGFLAKILVPSGTSDVKVGSPIGVTCESKGDVSAFEFFTLENCAGAPAAPKAAEPKAAKATAPAPPKPAAPAAAPPAAPKPAAPKPAAPAPAAPAAAPSPKPVPAPAPSAPAAGAIYPKISSPLKQALEAQRVAYEKVYGATLTSRASEPAAPDSGKPSKSK